MKFYMVKKRTLLLIAGIVWLIAGFNVAGLGIISYLNIEIKWFYFLLSALTLAGVVFVINFICFKEVE